MRASPAKSSTPLPALRMLESYRPFFLLQDITVDSFAIRILKTEELGAGNTIQVSYGTVRYLTIGFCKIYLSWCWQYCRYL